MPERTDLSASPHTFDRKTALHLNQIQLSTIPNAVLRMMAANMHGRYMPPAFKNIIPDF